MDIRHFSCFEGGGVIMAGDDGDENNWGWRAYFVHSKEQVQTVFSQYGRTLGAQEEVIVHGRLPPTSPSALAEVSAATVLILVHAFEVLAEYREKISFLYANSPTAETVFGFLVSNNPRTQDAFIGWMDFDGNHHATIFYSKEQGRRLLQRLEWQSSAVQARRHTTLNTSSLPETSPKPQFDLPEAMAAPTNKAMLVHNTVLTEARLKRASQSPTT